MDDEYDEFFGFTYQEVRTMIKYYGAADKEDELKEWYDGYLFGSGISVVCRRPCKCL